MSARTSLATRLAAALADAPRGVVSVYLHGSHARGKQHAESDVDVGVLLGYEEYGDRMRRDEARIRLIGRLQSALGRNDVDVVVLNDAPATFARDLMLDGIRVYCRDGQADHAFRRDAQLRAADLAPFLRRTRRVKLQAIRQ